MERENGEGRQPEIIASTYEIIGKIGAGGGGNVFLANHLRLGKKVVLKADKRKITTRPELLRREVDILKELNHPYIPGVYDFFVEDETVYTAMDYIEGESLDKPLKRGERFSQPQVVKWAIQLLEALSYLHSPTHGDPPRGFVHSDIKPANLMRTRDGDICLIDFNIALALGEENVIGCSAGYASPEHYGLDFSSSGETVREEDEVLIPETEVESGEETEVSVERTLAEPISAPGSSGMSGGSSGSFSSSKKVIVPDVRSDIYSTGATLYHLLSGRRPSRNARQVKPLSKEEFSPLIVDIITKAMNPNPDLRYQTADAMLYDFTHLHQRDPRLKRLKRVRAGVSALFLCGILAGTASTFTGLKRMQTEENWLKLAEYSANALETGDLDLAVSYAMQALPEKRSFLDPPYTAEAQRALAEALGVYDLADGFKTYQTVELPSAPLYMAISPDGTTGSCIYSGHLAIFDTASGDIRADLPADASALSEVQYLDKETVIYAGEGGITAYDIAGEQQLWQGEAATAIRISGDGKTAAGVYRDGSQALVYDTESGNLLHTVDFGEKRQSAAVNDSFANPGDNLLALNADGSLLAASFADGSLQVYDLENPDGDLVIFDETSGYTHFEGGFYQQYLAFSASGPSGSVFAVIDTEQMVQTGGFESQSPFSVQTDETGIYVQTENLLVQIHPVTGEQTPLVTMTDPILRYARSSRHTLAAAEGKLLFFDSHAQQIEEYETDDAVDFAQLAGDMALTGSRDAPVIRILQYESHPDTEVFAYDPDTVHDEARVSADGNTVMLFSYDRFYVYRTSDGSLIQEAEIPDAQQVYDQQFIRKDNTSWLEVIYNDGLVRCYSAADGSLEREEQRSRPDPELYEEFYTDRLRFASTLHGAPVVYDIQTGKELRQLEEDAYLTYVTQAGEYIVVQYVTADGYCYGQLLDSRCQVLADLPYLCDVIGDRLIFDYPTGNLRETRIYSRASLMDLAQK